MSSTINETIAFDLIKRYINGWKLNDRAEIVGCLSEDVVIIESHGPLYRGLLAVDTWFDLWLKANSKVTKWDITSLCFSEKQQAVFCLPFIRTRTCNIWYK